MAVDYMARLSLDEVELARRRSFFELGDDDLARLASLRPLAERIGENVIEGLYELLLGNPDSRAFFSDPGTVARVKRMQRQYFLGLFEGRCDLAYVEDRLRVGAVHERIGMAPKWYLGAYGRYLRLMLDHFGAELPPDQVLPAFRSLSKIVSFDMALAIDTYMAANLDTVQRHQAAIRELSTPVIRVHDRVLLLPLVGAVDSHRAQQIMESLLSRVAEEQARAVIVDIAGVAVVDTRVADHLLQTTAAVRLLGAQTILTGISAQVARTIVQLGVDISAMHTRARLADGIELALGMVGLRVMRKDA
jgi:rsbT co-antagonist protein RsbR